MRSTDFLKNDLWRIYVSWLSYDWMNPDIRRDFDAEQWMDFFDAIDGKLEVVNATTPLLLTEEE